MFIMVIKCTTTVYHVKRMSNLEIFVGFTMLILQNLHWFHKNLSWFHINLCSSAGWESHLERNGFFPPLSAAQMGFWSRNFAGIKLGYGSLTRKQNKKLCWILVRSPTWPTYIRIWFELISWDLREKCSNRAWCYSKLELHKHVIKDCDKALELNPSTLQAYLYKGVASHL